MSKNQKPVARALHTITVILQVAHHALETECDTVEQAHALAMRVLGLAGRPDPNGLAAITLKQLKDRTPAQ